MAMPTQRKDLELLLRTIRELLPQTDLDEILHHVLRVSVQILDADRALLFQFDDRVDALVFKCGVNIEEGIIEVAHQFSSSVIDRARKGEIVMAPDLGGQRSLPTSKSISRFDIRTVLCAPIMSGSRLIGVIYADTRGRESPLDEEKKDYFVTFVDFMGELLGRTLDRREKEDELAYLKKRLAQETIFPEIVGRSPAIGEVKEKVLRITSVAYPVSVLILGESGTGKELIARAIHQAGARASRPLVVVNCAAIPANLMESELFGHEKGAFTGAHTRKQGVFEVADRSTLLLDEIGDLPPELQPKLLRVLQSGTFTRVGGRTELSVDVQVLCATSKDLSREMEAGRFREALFHRLAVEIIHVPPLRERREDILLLASHFMSDFCGKMGKRLTGIDAGAQKLLKAHGYTGNNVRELKNVIERAVLTADDGCITARDIVFSDDLIGSVTANRVPPEAGEERMHIDEAWVADLLEGSVKEGRPEKKERPYYRVHAEMDRKLIFLALRHVGWKMKPAAERLGINYLSLKSKFESIIAALFEESGGDLRRVSRNHGIPLEFLKRRMKRSG